MHRHGQKLIRGRRGRRVRGHVRGLPESAESRYVDSATMHAKQDRSHSHRSLRLFSVIVVIIVVVVAGAVTAVNRLLLPKVAERLERSLEKSWDCSVEIGNLRYLPLYGIVARDVTVTRSLSAQYGPNLEHAAPNAVISSAGLWVGRMRIHSPELLAIRWMRGPTLDTAGIRNGESIAAIFTVAEAVADAGLLPRRISLNGLELEAGFPQRASMTTKTERVKLNHNSGGSTILVSTPPSAHDTLAGSLKVDYRDSKASGNLRIGPLVLTVPPFSGGTASLELSFRFDESSPVDFSGTLTTRNLSLEAPPVAEEPIAQLDIEYDFDGLFSRDAKKDLSADWSPFPETAAKDGPSIGGLVTTAGALCINGIALEMKLGYHGLYGGPAFFSTMVRLPVTEVQSIIESIPAALSGKLANTRATGTISYELDLRVPMEDISGMQWAADVDLEDFAVVKIDPSMNVFILNGEFVHTIPDYPAGLGRNVLIPPARQASMAWMLEHSEHTTAQIERIREKARAIAASRPEVIPAAKTRAPGKVIDLGFRYVYVEEMSPWIIRAVLTAEDGDFFFYGGINPVTFADAVAINLQKREIVVGASTISMQLIKTLFLDQKRIFARKIQEAFLVYLMEHQVPVSKERILELYLNLVEFGPGIYGVSDASRHYFNKTPSELSTGEATWLASVLPSPKTYYRQFEDGRISSDSFRRMDALYKIMLERGRMTPEQYRQAVAAPPEFAPPR